MKRASAKAKGQNAVKEVIAMLLEGTDLHKDDMPLKPGAVPGEDIPMSPYARSVYPISVEVKWDETLNILAAVKQCEENAIKATPPGQKSYCPVVFFRQTRGKMWAALPAETLVDLMQILFNHFQRTSDE